MLTINRIILDINKLSKGQRALLNAFIVGGIASFSSLITAGSLPTAENLWTGFIAGALACLIRINDFLSSENEQDKTYESKDRKPPKLGMLI